MIFSLVKWYAILRGIWLALTKPRPLTLADHAQILLRYRYEVYPIRDMWAKGSVRFEPA